MECCHKTVIKRCKYCPHEKSTLSQSAAVDGREYLGRYATADEVKVTEKSTEPAKFSCSRCDTPGGCNEFGCQLQSAAGQSVGGEASAVQEAEAWEGRVIEVDYETHRAIVRYEGHHPVIGANVGIGFAPTPAVEGLLREALIAMMEGSEYSTIQGDADWHVVSMPRRSALEMARKALAALAVPEAAQEPYAWHYWNTGGASVYHRGPSKALDADIAAAKQYPRTHHLIPLFTAAQPPSAKPEKHPPWCSGGCCNPEDAAPAQQGGGVYLVATGQEWEGQETYTRHEGSPPPLCDFEGPLYAAYDQYGHAGVDPNMRGPGAEGFGGFAEAFGDIFGDVFGGHDE